ncbi:palmitoyltransferase ZDHHC23 isoform X3 [Anomalospiza imberbis]|uniref:palmitoyltransferase ZDHHC23 isoform X3 n=1 Tax=Anomalospiza imberbis TaxID=187417 RepID=UPI00358F0272
MKLLFVCFKRFPIRLRERRRIQKENARKRKGPLPRGWAVLGGQRWLGRCTARRAAVQTRLWVGRRCRGGAELCGPQLAPGSGAGPRAATCCAAPLRQVPPRDGGAAPRAPIGARRRQVDGPGGGAAPRTPRGARGQWRAGAAAGAGPRGGGGGARGAPEAAAPAGAAPGPAGGTGRGGRRRWTSRSAAASTWTGAAGATTWRRAAATARSWTTAATALSRAKKDPGYLPIPAGNEKPSHQGLPNESIRGSSSGLHGVSGAASSRAVNGEAKGYCRMSAEQPAGVKKDWCTKCQLVRPARAGHCRLCGRCVRRLDHHCVWINSCVGEQNHQAFILALSFFMLTSVYGITLTLHTICRGRTPFVALFYCPGAYSDYRQVTGPHMDCFSI